MAVQIAVRLADSDLAFLDKLVADHRAESRADAVRRGLSLLRKQEEDRREVDLLRTIDGPVYPDLEGVAGAPAASTPPLD